MSDPEQARALFESALDSQNRGDLARAETLYRQALDLAPDLPAVLNNLAAVLVALKKYGDARTCCERLVQLDPASDSAHLNLGNCHMFLDAPAAALASYERALAIKPDCAEAVYGHGNALVDLDRLEEARASYQRLLAIRPDYVGALYNRGNVLLDLNRLKEALVSYEGALGVELPALAGKPSREMVIARVAMNPRECFEAEPLSAEAEKTIYLEPMLIDWSSKALAWASRKKILPLVARLERGSVPGLSFLPVTKGRITCLNFFVFNPLKPDKVRGLEDPAAFPATGPRSVLAFADGVDDYAEGVLIGNCENFGHWMLNHLARLALIAYAPGLERVPLVVGENIAASQLECLELMGCDISRLVRLRKGRLARFETLWAPMMPFCAVNNVTYWAPGIIDFIRQRLGVPRHPAPGNRRRRIYLTRQATRWRRVLNEDALLGPLADRGFEVVDPGLLTIRQQLELAAGAEVILGAFGSGMNLLLFAPGDTIIIEMKPVPGIEMNINPALAQRIGQRYLEIIGTPGIAEGVVPRDYDFTVDPDRLLNTLEALGIRKL